MNDTEIRVVRAHYKDGELYESSRGRPSKMVDIVKMNIDKSGIRNWRERADKGRIGRGV